VSEVVEINSLEQLDEIRLLWNSLLPQTPGASFYHTINWLEAFWRHDPTAQKPRILVVKSDSQPVGILPLCVRRQREEFGRLRILTYPLHRGATHFGPIGPNPTATLLAGMRHLQQTRRDWDVLDLRWVNARGLDRGRTPRAMLQTGFRPSASLWAESPALNLTGNWQDYLASRDQNWREHCAHTESRLAAKGRVEFLRYRPEGEMQDDSDPRWDLYKYCQAMEQSKREKSNGIAVANEPESALWRECHAAAVKLGMLDLNLLLVDQRPVGYAYNWHYQGNVLAWHSGSDPAFQEQGVERVLLARMIADSFERDDQHYHFGHDSTDVAQAMRTHMESSYRYTYYPRTALRARALRLKYQWKAWWSQRGSGKNQTQGA
jgi:hypothetical protein